MANMNDSDTDKSCYAGDSTMWNKFAARFVGSPFNLGYTNITRIKDLFDELKPEDAEAQDVTRQDEMECDVLAENVKHEETNNDGMDKDKKRMEASPLKNPVPGFPETVEELLKKGSKDEYTSINAMEHQYLCGCLDVLYAVRKSYHGKIPMAKKLREILYVKEIEQTSQRQPDSPKCSNVPKEQPHQESENEMIYPKSSSCHSTSPSSQSQLRDQSEKSHHERDNTPIGNSQISPSSKYNQTSHLVPRPTQPGGSGSRSSQVSNQSHSPHLGYSEGRGSGSASSSRNYQLQAPTTSSMVSTSTSRSPQDPYQSRSFTEKSSGRFSSYAPNSSSSQSSYQHNPRSPPSSSWSFPSFRAPKQPKQIAITVVSNKINGMTDGLLQGFIRSLNTADLIYNVTVVEPQNVPSSQRCIMGCVSASRVLSDVNAALALFPGQKPVQLIMAVLHPKASHVPLHVTTDQKLGPVPGVNAFCDIVFWDGQIYPCPMNERAKANFQQLFQG